MLGEEGRDGAAGNRRNYSRSVSWTDRAPATRKPPLNNRARSLLPPLQPLSITRPSLEDWPSAGSDDLGVWPVPQTPRGSIVLDSGTPGKKFEFKKDKLAFYDKECSKIDEHVYLGSVTVAKNHDLLRKNGITHVLNCVGFICPEYFKSDFVYKTLWLRDNPTEDITSILYDVFDYFEDVRQQDGRVLVHCYQGVSRSTSLVIAYLMWRNGQSFDDAFHFVKNARGITSPNYGFTVQLLQCQKRVHAMPASPKSIVRMYRMAPHSPYDPLHLVPKMTTQPCAKALDSRGAFIVHVPSAIYVWIGKNCSSVMSCNAQSAANQVLRYEKAIGPILSFREDEEPLDFWYALSNQKLLLPSNGDKEVVKNDTEEKMEIDIEVDMGVRPRKVDKYDSDFEIFNKALAGGVVPPFSVYNAGSETRLPARENGWGRLRRKLACGIMKGFFVSPKCCDTTSLSKDESSVKMQGKNQHCGIDTVPLSPTQIRVSPDFFECSLDSSLDRAKDKLEVMDHFVPGVDSSLPPSPLRTSDSFPCFIGSSPKFSCKSPTLSPCGSDYASSLTFSPSSTNWSDLSFMSSRQPSPCSLESNEPVYAKDASFSEGFTLPHKEAFSSPSETLLANHTLAGANFDSPSKGSQPSIAERRGSSLPPRMLLPSASISESSLGPKILVKSHSFSLPDLDDNLMKDVSCKQSDQNSEKWVISDTDIIITAVESEINGRESL